MLQGIKIYSIIVLVMSILIVVYGWLVPMLISDDSNLSVFLGISSLLLTPTIVCLIIKHSFFKTKLKKGEENEQD